jgi:hypothetical protein
MWSNPANYMKGGSIWEKKIFSSNARNNNEY